MVSSAPVDFTLPLRPARRPKGTSFIGLAPCSRRTTQPRHRATPSNCRPDRVNYIWSFRPALALVARDGARGGRSHRPPIPYLSESAESYRSGAARAAAPIITAHSWNFSCRDAAHIQTASGALRLAMALAARLGVHTAGSVWWPRAGYRSSIFQSGSSAARPTSAR